MDLSWEKYFFLEICDWFVIINCIESKCNIIRVSMSDFEKPRQNPEYFHVYGVVVLQIRS